MYRERGYSPLLQESHLDLFSSQPFFHTHTTPHSQPHTHRTTTHTHHTTTPTHHTTTHTTHTHTHNHTHTRTHTCTHHRHSTHHTIHTHARACTPFHTHTTQHHTHTHTHITPHSQPHTLVMTEMHTLPTPWREAQDKLLSRGAGALGGSLCPFEESRALQVVGIPFVCVRTLSAL